MDCIDIEKEAEWLLTAAPIAQLTGKEFQKSNINLVAQVTDFFANIKEVNRREIGTVFLEKRGIRSSIAHGISRNKAIAFAAVPEIIKTGVIINQETNYKNRGYDNSVIAAPISIGGEVFIAEVIVNQYNDGINKFYC